MFNVTINLLCCFAWISFWYFRNSKSKGRLLPGTLRLKPRECLLQVKLLAQYSPFGKWTPHCRSTSTELLGLTVPGPSSTSLFTSSKPSPSVARPLSRVASPEICDPDMANTEISRPVCNVLCDTKAYDVV